MNTILGFIACLILRLLGHHICTDAYLNIPSHTASETTAHYCPLDRPEEEVGNRERCWKHRLLCVS